MYQYSSRTGKRTAVFRSECSVKYPRPAYALQLPSRGANTEAYVTVKDPATIAALPALA